MQYIPQINSDSALKELAKKENVFAWTKNICRHEMLYLPYFMFKCKVYSADNTSREFFICVDQLNGECAHINGTANVNNSNSLSGRSLITVEEAKENARKFLISEILYKKKKITFFENADITLTDTIEYPYWIGYYKTTKGIDFNAIDAVTGQKQGPRMKAVFIKYLMQLS